MPGESNEIQVRSDLPGGTVTFLFTDIEGSTDLLRRLRERYADLLADHHRLLRECIAKWHGRVVDTQGDAFFVAFQRATDAVNAAPAAQKAFAQHSWPDDLRVRVRMGIHTGEPLQAVEGYVGMDVHRAARIAHVGHGGQVLLSETTAALIRGDLPEGIDLQDLGHYVLKDIRLPEPISQLVIKGLEQQFQPLKAEQIPPPPLLDLAGPPRLPSFLLDDVASKYEPSPFVARKSELSWLAERMQQTCDGKGQVIFVTGEAGAGKTALVQAFLRQAQLQQPNLLVTTGQCNAYAGKGDPYLPFRQVMEMLTGDVEARYLAGVISPDHARKLWETLPETVAAIVEHGPDILPVFLPGTGALKRLNTAAYAGTKLADDFRQTLEQSDIAGIEQRQLFDQYGRVLKELAERGPLLLVLDDLQWTDTGSANLLFHLGRELINSPILILAAYRPEEVEIDQGGERHPLSKLLGEFKRLYGDVWLHLNRIKTSDRQAFVNALIDSEPNQLSPSFRWALFQHTEGHALFTVELLRDLQERGELVMDAETGWVESVALDWQALPAKVEGIIEERINRLQVELKELLTIASVEGEDFTAQVIARVHKADERTIVRQLSRELDCKHRLVGEQGVVQLGRERLFRYRFRHSLFQQHLYNGLGEIERQLLHEDVGSVLEALYGEEAISISPKLAWHYSEAGNGEKATIYLLQAGDRARLDFAFREAIQHYERALSFLREQNDNALAARTLMKLGMCLHDSYQYGEAQKAFDEASVLSEQSHQSSPILEQRMAPQTFRIAHLAEPFSLDPRDATRQINLRVVAQIFSGLVHLNAEYELETDVAASWQILDDGLRYIFKLRDDVYWSDGEKVKASDFMYAWKRVLEPANRTGQPYLLFDVKNAQAFHEGAISCWRDVGICVRNDLILEVTLEKPTSYLLQLLTQPITFPVPEHLVRAHQADWTKSEHIVSNGPFLLVSLIPGEKLVFRRNPNYHGTFRGNCASVELTIPPAHFGYSLESAPYLEDRLDVLWLGALRLEERRRAFGMHIDEISRVREGTVFGLAFNCQHPPFDNPHIRRALALTIDKNQLVNRMKEIHRIGNIYPAHGGIVAPGMPGHSPDIGLPHDPASAKKLLAQAGYPNGFGFPKLVGVTTDFTLWFNAMEELSRGWLELLGINVSWNGVTGQEWEEMGRKNQHLWSTGWIPDYHDPNTYLHSDLIYQTSWEHSEFERLLSSAQSVLEQEERIKLYQKADIILVAECPFIPLWYGPTEQLYMTKPWVRQYPTSPYVSDIWKDVIIEPH